MNKGYTSTELQKILDEMSHIGILEYDYGDLYDRNGPIEGKENVDIYFRYLFQVLLNLPI